MAKGEVDRPFPQEAEYQKKSARLKELNVLLKLDEKDNQVFECQLISRVEPGAGTVVEADSRNGKH